MQQYLHLCQRILNEGEQQKDRTGIGTIGIFGAMMQFDLRKGFPLLTTKRVLFETVVDELLWFIRGGHNINDVDAPKRIWDEWADADGELGRIYGVQWREWSQWRRETLSDGYEFHLGTFDQFLLAIDRVKKLPNSRRNLVSAWNVAELETPGTVNFPPCHVMFQLKVMGEGKRLDLAMYQRSADMCLGVPFNIASYALLLTLIANECGLIPGIFTHFLADAHVYLNHVDTLKKQLQREPRKLPKLFLLAGPAEAGVRVMHSNIMQGFSVIDIRKQHIHLQDYNPHGFLRYVVAV